MKRVLKNISKVLFSLLLIFSIFGTINVLAEEVIFKITNISVKEKSSGVTVNDVSLSGETITNDIVFTDKDDYITYNITFKNNTSDKYKILSISDDNDSEYLDYTYDDLSNIELNGGDEKTFNLTITYKKETTNSNVTDKAVNLTLSYEKEDGTTGTTTITNNNKITNPKTGDNIYRYIIMCIISLIGLGVTLFNKKKLSKTLMVMGIASTLIIPFGVKANSNSFIIKFNNTIKNADYNVVFNANGGKFSDNSTLKTIPYRKSGGSPSVKISHTENVDDTGKQLSEYGDYWNNSNIVGTDRGDTDKAHVVTIDGADQIIVDIYYNGENTDYDWACVWEGNHPDYDCENNYSETINGEKLGGEQDGTYTVNGNELTYMGHKKYVIDGDSVTFGFVSDSFGSGEGYGYYAIVKANIEVDIMDTIPTPTIDQDLVFVGWCSEPVCTKANKINPMEIYENKIVYAYWSKKESTLNKTKFREYTNVLNVNGNIPQTKIKPATLEEFNAVKGSLNESNIVSTVDSIVPTYCWKTEDTIYYYSIGTIYLPEDSSELFWLFRYVEEIDVSGFDTSRVKDMSFMFSQMQTIKKLDLSNFNTENVTNMRQVFGLMDKLEELDISSFNTSNVTNMSTMFASVPKIKELDLSNFDTSKVENFREMFGSDTMLEKIYVSDKFVINVADPYYLDRMFKLSTTLKGGKGTIYDASHFTGEYARIDDPDNGKPGYFTDIKDKPQN